MSATIPRTGRTPARTTTIVLAVIALVIGVVVALAGGVLLLVFGRDGNLSSSRYPVSSPTAAVVTDTAAITETSRVARVLGTPTLRLQVDGGNAAGLFVGIGPAADVDRYLQGVAVDQATDVDLDPYRMTLTRRDGTATAPAPATQGFWVASATAHGVTDLSWTVRDGDYRVVLMNADGVAGLNSELGAGIGLPRMFSFAMAMFAGGLVLVLAGVLVLVLGRPRRSREPRG
jgi:hypothetical protein